jgi:hypothetical protein
MLNAKARKILEENQIDTNWLFYEHMGNKGNETTLPQYKGQEMVLFSNLDEKLFTENMILSLFGPWDCLAYITKSTTLKWNAQLIVCTSFQSATEFWTSFYSEKYLKDFMKLIHKEQVIEAGDGSEDEVHFKTHDVSENHEDSTEIMHSTILEPTGPEVTKEQKRQPENHNPIQPQIMTKI